MLITATELKNNIGKYLALAATHDIYITKNGKSIAKLTSAAADKVALLDSLVGIVPDGNLTLNDIKKERLKKQ
ncbi:type II toxin-antitoxin system Phd/YefM family antitoxin [Phosphitispora sp. TUW77]|uniref:type II toxin-antitoxin system Phd/YefM family antitoxin n=1 Tax=Phosphitispora sp. TUW77 TaxID=3152361 RepID=UPI003AB39320